MKFESAQLVLLATALIGAQTVSAANGVGGVCGGSASNVGAICQTGLVCVNTQGKDAAVYGGTCMQSNSTTVSKSGASMSMSMPMSMSMMPTGSASASASGAAPSKTAAASSSPTSGAVAASGFTSWLGIFSVVAAALAL